MIGLTVGCRLRGLANSDETHFLFVETYNGIVVLSVIADLLHSIALNT